MKVAALKCPVCEAVIWSKATHDFQTCVCKKCFIDGGRSYTRTGWEPGLKPVMGVIDTSTLAFAASGEEDVVH
jgi:hypothetical protein